MGNKNLSSENKKLISKIRHHINEINKQNILLENLDNWNKLCSSLDLLEDTTSAIYYYIDTDYPEIINGKYLFTYGLLQALFLQQDALNSLNQSLFHKKIDFANKYPKLKEIRDIRNDVVGHPTNRQGNKFIFLSQHSMNKYSFEYSISYKSDTFKNIDVKELINNNNIEVNQILNNSVKKLDAEFKDYIELHKEKKLTQFFNGTNFYREKILTNKYTDITGFLKNLSEMIKNCKEELDKRYTSWEKTDSFSYVIKEIEELIKFINCKTENKFLTINKYLIELLFCKIDFLLKCCKETDDYFNDYYKPENYNEKKIKIIIDNIPNNLI